MDDSTYKPRKPIYVMTESHDPSQWESLIEHATTCKFWCYIYHDNDYYNPDDPKDAELIAEGKAVAGAKKAKHLHVFCQDSPRKLDTWSNVLQIPSHMIEIVTGRSNALLYLTHESYKAKKYNKTQYDRSLLVTNDRVRYESYIAASETADYESEIDDFNKLSSGILTPKEYLLKNKTMLAVTPYQRLNIYAKVFSAYKSGGVM